MARKNERSILLFCMLFVFACLLLGGGWRLIGGEPSDDSIPVRPYTAIRAALSQAPAGVQEGISQMRRVVCMQRMHGSPAKGIQVLSRAVTSDANGNVLAAGTYMRAVYQAFALDDGFV